MKLTKKLETEVLKFYKTYWDCYLNGDMKTLASMLDDNVTVFGTAVSEVFNNKKETIRFYKTTADQLTGKAQFRKRQINLKAVDETILINEKCDLYFLLEKKWTYYGNVRVTAVLKQTNTAWKLVQQHASFPDVRAEEGEQLAAEKIKEENIQLRDAVKRRTIELEEKNRELVIESAVERVRAKALAMRRSEDISGVANVLRKELGSLHIPGIAAATITLQQKNGKIRLWDITSVVELKEGFHFAMDILFDLKETKPNDWIRRIWDSKKKYYVYKQDKRDFKRTLEWTAKYDPAFVENARHFLEINNIKNTWHPVVPLSHGKLSLDLFAEPSAEVEIILTKMGAAFDLAYKRFLDLQKAETQAREAQIEVAVERVRAKALAMHKSEEIIGVIKTLYKEIKGLNISGVMAATIYLTQDDGRIRFWDLTALGEDEDHFTMDQFLPVDVAPSYLWFQKMLKAKEKYFIIVQNEKDLELSMDWIRKVINEEVALSTIEFLQANNYKTMWHPTVRLANGLLNIDFVQPPPDEIESILVKMGAAFDLAYKRFLDLQKAEAQAREAKIEAALERVRSRAMAMHKTNELLEAAELVSKELSNLGLESMNVSYAFVDDDEKYGFYYSGNPVDGKILPLPLVFPHTETEVMRSILSSWKKQDPYNVIELDEEATLKHQTWVGEHIQNLFTKHNINIHFSVEEFLAISPKKAVIHSFNFSKGYLFNIGGVQLTKEQEDMLLRFTKVFDLTYRRFLDLKQAEAQAREAQIELGLERVRARAMAMQNSDELKELIGTVFTELTKLDLVLTRCVIMIYDGEENSSKWWMANSEDPDNPVGFYIKPHDYPPMNAYFNAWHDRKLKYTYELKGQVKKDWDEFLFTETELKNMPDFVIEGMKAPDIVYLNASFNNFGNLTLASLEPLSDEHFDILLRFAKVFDLTYTRFNDLKQAEAQAREGQIELALERVRARTIGMQHSEELQEAASLLFQQVKALGVDTGSCGFNIWDKNEKAATVWMSSAEGGLQIPFKLPHTESEIYKDVYDAMQRNEIFLVKEIDGKALKKHFDYLLTVSGIGEIIKNLRESGYTFPEKMIYHFVFFKQGYLSFHLHEHFPGAHDIFKRFAKVFEQTYTRFLDLQKAETQAREARIEAALEKVRSRSLAMHKSDELKEVIRVVLEQFLQLDINVGHAGFYIDYKKQDDMHIWLADPNIEPFFAVIPYFESPTWNSFLQAKTNGATFFTDLLDFEEKNKFYRSLFKIFTVPDEAEKFYLQCKGLAVSTVLLDDVGLYIENFSAIPYTDEENKILMRFGKVFDQSYTRFLDLKKAEAQAIRAEQDLVAIKEAKQKAEDTLAELQVTQKQLIQSEKMASLGELTAGIAHEIQNPLNFVNNFSDVSNELIQEMLEEVEKGNYNIAKEIAEDVKQNLEKINHHGKRADGIVKGMLQHSRTSSGQKELTDINALCDEYLRLSYHGLRAKDKSFNATMKTDFDASIGNINIIPQDIGRVVLNLINNAFYAVDEKKKSYELLATSYEPTVTVSTKKVGDKVHLSVKDNGNGIPQKILDKIFQPFFTTKPTGQGTGLGLSLSYDIVKAHGGEIKVETRENEGTTFIIMLPSDNIYNIKSSQFV